MTNSNHHPEFIRLPKPGERCPLTGLTRGSLNDLILGSNPPVKSLVLKQDGASRGIRLIHRQSLIDWLYQVMGEQNGEN